MKPLTRSDSLQKMLDRINVLVENANSYELLNKSLGRVSELPLKVYDTSTLGIVNMEVYVVEVSGVYRVDIEGSGISRIVFVNGLNESLLGEETLVTTDQGSTSSQNYTLSNGDKIMLTLSPGNKNNLKASVLMVGSLYTTLSNSIKSLQQSIMINQHLAEDTSTLIERQTGINEATQEIVDHYLTQISSLQADYVDLISRFQLLSGYAIGGYEITIPFREWKKENASYSVIVEDENVFAETEIRACLVRVIWDDDSLKKISRRMHVESNAEGGTFKIAIKERPLGDISGTVTFSPVYKRSIVDVDPR